MSEIPRSPRSDSPRAAISQAASHNASPSHTSESPERQSSPAPGRRKLRLELQIEDPNSFILPNQSLSPARDHRGNSTDGTILTDSALGPISVHPIRDSDFEVDLTKIRGGDQEEDDSHATVASELLLEDDNSEAKEQDPDADNGLGFPGELDCGDAPGIAFAGSLNDNASTGSRGRSLSAPVSSPDTPRPAQGSGVVGRWTPEEQSQFLKGLQLYGRDWKKISSLVPTRTLMQIRTHAQKYFKKLAKTQIGRQIAALEQQDDSVTEKSQWEVDPEEEGDVNGHLKVLDLQFEASMPDPAPENRGPVHVGSRRGRSQSVPSPDYNNRRASDPMGGLISPKKHFRTLRSGRWTKEEEEYANRLIADFDAGILPIPEGTMLRMFLAHALRCDPMRISKKFVGNSAIGKHIFKRDEEKLKAMTPEEFAKQRKELAALEKNFLKAVKASMSAYNMPLAIASAEADRLKQEEANRIADYAADATSSSPGDNGKHFFPKTSADFNEDDAEPFYAVPGTPSIDQDSLNAISMLASDQPDFSSTFSYALSSLPFTEFMRQQVAAYTMGLVPPPVELPGGPPPGAAAQSPPPLLSKAMGNASMGPQSAMHRRLPVQAVGDPDSLGLPPGHALAVPPYDDSTAYQGLSAVFQSSEPLTPSSSIFNPTSSAPPSMTLPSSSSPSFTPVSAAVTSMALPDGVTWARYAGPITGLDFVDLDGEPLKGQETIFISYPSIGKTPSTSLGLSTMRTPAPSPYLSTNANSMPSLPASSAVSPYRSIYLTSDAIAEKAQQQRIIGGIPIVPVKLEQPLMGHQGTGSANKAAQNAMRKLFPASEGADKLSPDVLLGGGGSSSSSSSGAGAGSQ